MITTSCLLSVPVPLSRHPGTNLSISKTRWWMNKGSSKTKKRLSEWIPLILPLNTLARSRAAPQRQEEVPERHASISWLQYSHRANDVSVSQRTKWKEKRIRQLIIRAYKQSKQKPWIKHLLVASTMLEFNAYSISCYYKPMRWVSVLGREAGVQGEAHCQAYK